MGGGGGEGEGGSGGKSEGWKVLVCYAIVHMIVI